MKYYENPFCDDKRTIQEMTLRTWEVTDEDGDDGPENWDLVGGKRRMRVKPNII